MADLASRLRRDHHYYEAEDAFIRHVPRRCGKRYAVG
jgi:hypothetical protein